MSKNKIQKNKGVFVLLRVNGIVTKRMITKLIIEYLYYVVRIFQYVFGIGRFYDHSSADASRLLLSF